MNTNGATADALAGRRVVLGITGSIAAYKACVLTRLLVKAGAEVQVIMTPSAKEFVTPLTLSTLTRKPVVSEFFDRRDGSWHSHVALGEWADVMLIAPASANTIAKMAHGVADNMLLTTYLSMRAPVLVAPAMDCDMYAHPSTQRNLRTLTEGGVHIIEPTCGELASQLTGKGRMEEPENIVERLTLLLTAGRDLAGRRILITAGPTHERLDPVRFLGNHSSGKMGYALARECARRGAEVELVSGPVELDCPSHVRRTGVESAEEMLNAAVDLFPSCDGAILAAAVADFTPVAPAAEKIKRQGDSLTLELRPTEDIAARLAGMRKEGQRLVGFALETCDEVEHAREKLRRKGLDLIVLNSLRDEGAGFGHETNKVTIITPDGHCTSLPLKSKAEVAADIVNELARLLR